MKTLVETTPSAARPPLSLRVIFLIAAAFAVLVAQTPLASLAARVIG